MGRSEQSSTSLRGERGLIPEQRLDTEPTTGPERVADRAKRGANWVLGGENERLRLLISW